VSFWTGRVNGTGTTATTGTADSAGNITPPPPPIVPAPRPPLTLPAAAPLEDETVTVPPTLGGAYTRAALQKGQRYRVEVRGTWKWNRLSGSLADGECSITAGTDWWPFRYLARVNGDQLGLYLDGHDLSLASYGGGGCASSSHTYTVTLTPTRTGRVPLKLWEPTTKTGYGDNSGAVRVRLIHDVARDVLPVKVDTHERWGTTTPGSVVAGQTYTVTTSGTWSPAPGTTADAVCVDTDQGQQQPRDQYRHRLWRLSVDGQSMRGQCSADHRYTWTLTAQHSGPLVLRIDADDYSTKQGLLDVVLTRVTDAGSGGTPTA
jgi:hypothetical protein